MKGWSKGFVLRNWSRAISAYLQLLDDILSNVSDEVWMNVMHVCFIKCWRDSLVNWKLCVSSRGRLSRKFNVTGTNG